MWWCWDDSLHSVFCSCSLTTVALQVFLSLLTHFEDVHFSLVLHSVFNPCSLTVALHVLVSNFAKFFRMFTLFTLKQQPFHIRDPSLWPWEVLFSRLPEAARTRMIESMCTNILAHLKSWTMMIMRVNCLLLRRWIMCNDNDNDYQSIKQLWESNTMEIVIMMKVDCLLLRRRILSTG